MKRQKKDVWKCTERRKVKRFIYHSKKKTNEQFGRKMIEDVNGNRKLFFLSRKGCSRVKDGNGRLA